MSTRVKADIMISRHAGSDGRLTLVRLADPSTQVLPDSQHSLGYIYMIGEGVSKDFDEAVKWYKLAAVQGFRSSQGNLGLLYPKGYGVPQNNLLAHMWSNLGKTLSIRIGLPRT